MPYVDRVSDLAMDTEQLELLYRAAVTAGQTDEFVSAIRTLYEQDATNLLYAAWFHRLAQETTPSRSHAVAWAWAILLAVANGLLFWWLSGEQFVVRIARFSGAEGYGQPALLLVAGPTAALFALLYLALADRRGRPLRRIALAGLIAACLAAAVAYAFWVYPQTGAAPYQEQYLILMALHLPLLSWAAVGFYLVAQHRDPTNRFGFLAKSIEVAILGGLFVMAGGLLTALTMGLFDALGVTLSNLVQRLFYAGGGGLIPVVTVAVLYDPLRSPAEQSFQEGLSKLVALLLRLILPLSLLVLIVYLLFIPSNFRAPFENRDVLIIYTSLLFAVMGLLVGSTPVKIEDLSPRQARWLRRGIIALTAVALLISIYALAAIIYRTAMDRLTPNRLAFIGWNLINTGLLVLLLVMQRGASDRTWTDRLHRVYSVATVAYTVWALLVLLAIPWLFGFDREAVKALPPRVQQIVYEHPDPILLKCQQSPHIYLLDGQSKRWIDSIATFGARGYKWQDVQIIDCDDLRVISDGTPIPRDAGPPPQP